MQYTDITYSENMSWSWSPPSGVPSSDPDGRYFVQLSRSLAGQRLCLAQIRPGMSLLLCDFTPQEDLSSSFEMDKGAAVFATVMAWRTEGRDHHDSRPCQMVVEHPCDIICATSDRSGDITFRKGQRYCYVSLVLRTDVLEEFLSHDEHRDQSIFSRLDNPHEMGIVDKRPASPQTQLIATQMLNCPFQGSCGQIFLEGKALELLSFGLNQLKENQKPFSVSLSRGDVKRLRHAKNILLQDLENPPSIPELAIRAGLNEYKLKKGFREVFGRTVYETLRGQRMHAARTLLLDTDMTVGMAAATVGYTNLGHFISAFRRQFGVTPGSLLQNSRRNHFLRD